jgi:hypothetical protein
MSNRNQPDQSQSSAAAKAGLSERSAHRIDSCEHKTPKPPRNFRTRKDPLDGLFAEHIVPLPEQNPGLQPITLLAALEGVAPGQFNHSNFGTLQRRVKCWRAQYGPDQVVIFRQRHAPGEMVMSDYTWANKLNITLVGVPFEHKFYHYRLVFSGWPYVQVCLGGESFESLSSGLQNAFWRSCGVPTTHHTASLSAVFNNHAQEQLLTDRYDQLSNHYGVIATCTNTGVAHENGAIEFPNRHLKHKIEQQLLLRNSRDFASLAEYEAFIGVIVSKINRQRKTRFDEEWSHLKLLSTRRTHDFSELFVKVTPSSTISVKRVTYTVPSSPIGSMLLAHIYDDRLELFLLDHEPTLTLDRIRSHGRTRSRKVDYRHIIHSLAKKPNAFKCCQLRDAIIPQGDLSILWQRLTKDYVSDRDCRCMVDLLLLVHNYDCEYALGRYALRAYEVGSPVSVDQCRDFSGTAKIDVPVIIAQQHSINSYDSLMGGAHG